jgi:hypothetical protein
LRQDRFLDIRKTRTTVNGGQMKKLAMIIILILTNKAMASNSCFNDEAVKALIEASEELNECFEKDVNNCKIDKMSVENQRELNSQRLIPFDRSKSKLMNEATGAVSADFGQNDVSAASGQKISSCHIVTSAHLLYTEMGIPVDAQDKPALKDSEHFDIDFHSKQTCDSRLFESKVGAQVFFKMTKEGKDFVCGKRDNSGKCLERRFYGKSDLVILKLKNYNKKDKNFFKLKTSPLSISKTGDRVNCWGYPEHNSQIKLSKAVSDKMLWFQKDAKIFNGKNDKGILTNAVAYPGMSGGGCVASNNPQELVGVFAARNSASGNSAVELSERTAATNSANFIASFQNLAERYEQATGKDISNLDDECE